MADESKPKTKMVAKWYFGGLASAGAACCTHPLDLLKVYFMPIEIYGCFQ
jgi:dicarboxylate transporter 10